MHCTCTALLYGADYAIQRHMNNGLLLSYYIPSVASLLLLLTLPNILRFLTKTTQPIPAFFINNHIFSGIDASYHIALCLLPNLYGQYLRI